MGPNQRAAAIRRGWLAAVAVGLAASGAMAQATDAISREVSIYNTVLDAVVGNAHSREISLHNAVLDTVVTDSNSREVSIANMARSVVVTSSGPALARPVTGPLNAQLVELNASPPALDGSWVGVLRRTGGSVVGGLFCAESAVNPAVEPYITTTGILVGVDEVSLDNQRSAFYRFTFQLPCAPISPYQLSGTVNASHQAVAYLNGVRISALMTVPACSPMPPLCEPQECYALQDAGSDRVDTLGRAVLTEPTPDAVLAIDQSVFRPAPLTNELVFAVAGDAQPLDPTGLQFALVVFSGPPACPADFDCSGTVDVPDIFAFLAAWFASDPRADFDLRNGIGVPDIFAYLSAWFAGCP